MNYRSYNNPIFHYDFRFTRVTNTLQDVIVICRFRFQVMHQQPDDVSDQLWGNREHLVLTV